jgi:hypothetical protein
MQTAIVPATRRAAPTTSKKSMTAPKVTTSPQPPTIHPELEPVNDVRYPREIFGRLPLGFVLANQQIQMLVFWLRNAMKAVDDLQDKSDVNMAAALAPANELIDAIKGFKAKRPSEVAAQMRAIVEWLEFLEEDSVEVELNLHNFKHLTQCLVDATAPLRPKKKTGALSRGGKLTRFGLLHRYQAFLIQELETIGWHVYGERDYPMVGPRPVDFAVVTRCNHPTRCYPFFDESKLSDRARKVLKGLRIDTQRDDAGMVRKPRKRGSR